MPLAPITSPWLRSRHGLSAALVLLAALLPACDDAPATTPPDTLVIAMNADTEGLDPHKVEGAQSYRILENAHRTLLRYGAGLGTFEPDIATDIEISEDGRTVTLRLDPAAQFGPDNPITADDVVWSLQRINDEGTRGSHLGPVESIGAAGPHTVVLRLAEPYAPLPSYLAHPMNAVLDRGAFEAAGGDFMVSDFGAGPYRVKGWRVGSELLLERREGYNGPTPAQTPRLAYRPIADDTAKSTAVRRGEVHLVHEVSPKHTVLLEEAEGIEVASVPGTWWDYLGLNTRQPPLDDPRVRRAIALAIDRQDIVDAVFFGRATPLTAANLPPTHWAALPEPVYSHHADLDAARALLAQAGLAGGFGLTLRFTTGYRDQAQAATMIKQQLRPLGIDVELQAMDFSALVSRLNSGAFEAVLIGWAAQVDPDEYLYDLFHSDGPFNQQGFDDAEVDRLLETGRTTFDRDARRRAYHAAQRRIAELAPMVFLYVRPQLTAVRDTVTGYDVHPTGTTRGAASATLAR